jgi:hypothetical protein
VAAPFATGYYSLSGVATTEAVVLGLVFAGLGTWTALRTDVPVYVDYVLMLCGGWSVLAPFVLAYSEAVTMARNCDVIAGIVVFAVAVYRAVSASPGARQNVTA